MSYDPRSVANYLIDIAKERGEALTPMKLQKLVYYAHGWHLALYGRPLINEQIEAWTYGPVIPSLYRTFREYGNSPITIPARHFRDAEDPDNPWTVTACEYGLEDCPEEIETVRPLLDRIWEVYGKFSAIQLSNATHLQGTPWQKTMEEYHGKPPRGTDIPSSRIQDYFRSQMEPASDRDDDAES